jgi:hypothetical protein
VTSLREELNVMNDESIESIEKQMIAAHPRGAPDGLRAAVLADIARELRSSRWDRRLVRAAAVLLVVGMGLNGAVGMRGATSPSGTQPRLVQSAPRQSLVDTAIVVAEATDAATGSRFARQLAAMSGRDLTSDEVAAIDAAVRRPGSHETTNGNRG